MHSAMKWTIATLSLLSGSARGWAEQVTYRDLAPILAARCAICHQGDGALLGLKLDTLDGLLAGSQNGPVVKAGKSAESELVWLARAWTSHPCPAITSRCVAGLAPTARLSSSGSGRAESAQRTLRCYRRRVTQAVAQGIAVPGGFSSTAQPQRGQSWTFSRRGLNHRLPQRQRIS